MRETLSCGQTPFGVCIIALVVAACTPSSKETGAQSPLPNDPPPRSAEATHKIRVRSARAKARIAERYVSSQAPEQAEAAASEADDGFRPVVLVTIDGIRWQDVFEGADRTIAGPRHVDVSAYLSPDNVAPNLRRLAREEGLALGVSNGCSVVTASGPSFVSLPGYIELFTGHSVVKCVTNDCPRVAAPTWVDDFASQADAPEEVGVFASWEPIDRAVAQHPEAMVVSAGAMHLFHSEVLMNDPELVGLLSEGLFAGHEPGPEGYRPDAYTAALALRYLVRKQPRFLFIGLGDADEYGHHDDYPAYLQSLRKSDQIVGELSRTLSNMGAWGRRATVIVTTDHGRAKNFRDHGFGYPESARSFLIAFGGGIPRLGMACAPRTITLADVGVTVGAMLGVDPDPPRRSGTPVEILTWGRANKREQRAEKRATETIDERVLHK